MTEEDRNEVRVIVREELATVIPALEARLIETMRDMQTEIIRALERFARGNFARMHRLEVSDNDLVERINALEERVLAVETRRPPPL